MENLTRYLLLRIDEEIAIPLNQVFSDPYSDAVAQLHVSLDGKNTGEVRFTCAGKTFHPASVTDGADGNREIRFFFKDGVRFRESSLVLAGPVVIRRLSLGLKRPRLLTVPFYKFSPPGKEIDLTSLVQEPSLPPESRLEVLVQVEAEKDARCRIRTRQGETSVVMKKRTPAFRTVFKTAKRRKDNRLSLFFQEPTSILKVEVSTGSPFGKAAPSRRRVPSADPAKLRARERLFLSPYDDSLPLYFHHIPKTAGSSLGSALIEWFDDSFFHYYADKERGTLPVKTRLVSRTAVTGHFSRLEGMGAELFPGPAQRITFIRDPFDIVVSNYFYTTDAGVAWKNPPPTLGRSLKQELERALEDPFDMFFNFLPLRPADETIEKWVRTNFIYVGLGDELQRCLGDLAVLLGRREIFAPRVNQSTYGASIPDLRKEFRSRFQAEYAFYDLVKEWHDSVRR